MPKIIAPVLQLELEDSKISRNGNFISTRGSLKPFLRWAGGKQRIAATIVQLIPELKEENEYYEPFFGGGSVFFNLQPSIARLSDLNAPLMDTYTQVRDYPDQVAKYLLYHAAHDSEAYYYQLRQEYNAGKKSPKQAARFIYLNRTCFNGIFRVNLQGLFNVPYGFRENPLIPTLDDLLNYSNVLQNTKLSSCDYLSAIETARDGDFVYLDPPYPALNGTSYFTHYTKERFFDADQIILSEIADNLRSRGCNVMISNADTTEVRELYSSWNLISYPVTRCITCKSNKHRVNELFITSYPTTTS